MEYSSKWKEDSLSILREIHILYYSGFWKKFGLPGGPGKFPTSLSKFDKLHKNFLDSILVINFFVWSFPEYAFAL